MKSKIKITGILLVLILFPVIFPKQASAQEPYISYQVFYDQLSPYGQWVDFPSYGYVWLPDAGSDFFPYSSRGYWIMTEYCWTWLSDYNWGWAPGYYGWAPMGPGISIGMSFGSNYNNYSNHWILVNERYFGRKNINRYYASQNDYDMLFSNSTVINNTYVDNTRLTMYVSGPTRSDVRGVTGRRVSSYTIRENNVPGQSLSNGQFSIYRPQLTKNNDNEQRSAPSMITNLQDVRRPSERNSASQQGNISTYGNRRQEQQQNVEKPNNERKEQSVTTVNTPRNIRSEESRKRFQQRK